MEITFDTFFSSIQNINKKSNKTLIIGKSVNNLPIFAYHYGPFNKKQILVTSAIHAREFVSASICSLLIAKHQFQNFGIWFVPFVNPDGIKMVIDEKLNLFKANANWVDLNVNFDANWGQGKSNLKFKNIENYIGPHPNSEPETQALTNFSKNILPSLTINFHTKGEVIYYGNFLTKKNKYKDKKLAKILSRQISYKAIQTRNSFGGFSDWCEMKLNIPSLTIELGGENLSHPIPLNNTVDILEKINPLFDELEKYFLH